MTSEKLFVGLTTWDSALFLEASLEGIRRTTADLEVEVFALDNGSEDATLEILRRFSVPYQVRRISQPDALNELLRRSRADFTLLMHPDTVLLDENWFDICRAKFEDPRIALVSPEDIGCGPMTRPGGRGMPESSFLLFHTARIRRAQHWRFVRHYHIPKWPQRVLDLYPRSVTHNLPSRLKRAGLSWVTMRVLTSRRLAEPIYRPPFEPKCWSAELEHLDYGLGNFYALDGTITHYHNWFDRFQENVPLDSTLETEDGIPNAYLRIGSERFLRDFRQNTIHLPSVTQPRREPRSLRSKGAEPLAPGVTSGD